MNHFCHPAASASGGSEAEGPLPCKKVFFGLYSRSIFMSDCFIPRQFHCTKVHAITKEAFFVVHSL